MNQRGIDSVEVFPEEFPHPVVRIGLGYFRQNRAVNGGHANPVADIAADLVILRCPPTSCEYLYLKVVLVSLGEASDVVVGADPISTCAATGTM